ncbi:methyltransferase domain-containing protein [Actinomadura graeca]|uniref:Methyltransferase domain-containing protein n=1 Tax=Actinomadura graeca TaxID=2750812 RepID=A0ABX8QSY6_9ACTN|nr:methyltransferase domain-containing protein [Actinomadura graeca]QXJ21840.1 methyltransferase domain-containing protein [Actinomadura graeca]
MSASPTEEGLWDEQADDWAELQEAQCAPLFAAALAALGAGPGTTLLDVGCGSGVALRQAADRGAAVSGLDFSAGLIGLARRRVPEAAGLHVGGMDRLPFEDASFDAVTSFNALRYAGDPAATVAEFARVTRGGGAVCVGGWGEPPECETTGFLFAVVMALPELPQGSGADAPNTPEQIRGVMRGAGLEPAETAKVPCPFVYRDVEAAWRALGSTGLLRFAVDRLGEPAVRDLFDAHFRPAVLPDGTVRQENVFEYSIARTPA